MRPSIRLEENREAIRAAVERNHTANPRVFGSVLRGEDREDSDLDILVDTFPDTSLLDIGGLREDLEELLGIRIDILTPGSLPKKWRDRVLAEARPI